MLSDQKEIRWAPLGEHDDDHDVDDGATAAATAIKDRTQLRQLRNGAVLMADDVERNRAFGELLQRSPALWRVVQDREETPFHGRAAPVVFGIAIK